jgi:hypothetical protein
VSDAFEASDTSFNHLFNKNIMTFNIQKALEILLSDKYFSEFEVIDGANQHPKGINFYTWLADRKIITENERKELQSAANAQYAEDY